MSIKTNFEFPRGTDSIDIIKQGQRLAQDLSKNFKTISNMLDPLTEGTEFTQDFSYTSGSQVYNYTFVHNFNTIPSGFYIKDMFTNAPSTTFEQYHAIRTSWTSKEISIKISYSASTSIINGSFKIIILR
jgi:hypothetical protein